MCLLKLTGSVLKSTRGLLLFTAPPTVCERTCFSHIRRPGYCRLKLFFPTAMGGEEIMIFVMICISPIDVEARPFITMEWRLAFSDVSMCLCQLVPY